MEQPQPGDAEILAGIESEMVEDEIALLRKLMGAAVASIPADQDMGEKEMRAEIERLIAEDPELREVAERLAVRTKFREQGR